MAKRRTVTNEGYRTIYRAWADRALPFVTAAQLNNMRLGGTIPAALAAKIEAAVTAWAAGRASA